MDVSRREEQDDGAPLLVADRVEFGVPTALGEADTMSQGPPFSAAGAAMDLDADAVDEQPVRRRLGTGQGAEDVFPSPRSDQRTKRL